MLSEVRPTRQISSCSSRNFPSSAPTRTPTRLTPTNSMRTKLNPPGRSSSLTQWLFLCSIFLCSWFLSVPLYPLTSLGMWGCQCMKVGKLTLCWDIWFWIFCILLFFGSMAITWLHAFGVRLDYVSTFFQWVLLTHKKTKLLILI